MGPLVSYVIATYNRKDALEDVIESVLAQTYDRVEIVVMSQSNDGTRDLFLDGAKFDREKIQFHEYDEPLGVTKARNLGYEKAEGDILVTIDDDELMADQEATTKTVEQFEADYNLGLVAYRVQNYYTGEMEFPKGPTGLEESVPFLTTRLPKRLLEVDEPVEVPFFCGGGNAVRREVFEEVGTLPSSFFYGGEEEDLAFRILDAGYRMKYLPSVLVEHKHHPDGRIEGREKYRTMLENRIAVAVRNLPWPHAVRMIVLWTGQTLVRSRFDVSAVAAALSNVFGDRGQLLSERSVISKETRSYIRSIGGRLY